MKFKFFLSIFVTIATISCAHADNVNEDIVISDAWVQAMPPSQTNSAAYMTIGNDSKEHAAVIIGVSSDIARVSEIHQMSEMNGMMNMAPVSSLNIPAQGKVTLQPGGFHIMLINLKKPVNKGDKVSITLHFKDGSDASVIAQVQDQQSDDSSSMVGMKM